jgi:hypothetical protein
MAVHALALVLALAGCSAVPLPSPPADFTGYLEGYGQRFVPEIAPPDAADWRPAVVDFPFLGAQVDAVSYGVVSCFDPTRNCAERGLVRPQETLAIWLVTFVEAPANGGCPVWATVDATTGSFINGSGPPC